MAQIVSCSQWASVVSALLHIVLLECKQIVDYDQSESGCVRAVKLVDGGENMHEGLLTNNMSKDDRCGVCATGL